ncbi:hypothetical protein ABZP36_033871 [Zizania latifolia]
MTADLCVRCLVVVADPAEQIDATAPNPNIPPLCAQRPCRTSPIPHRRRSAHPHRRRAAPATSAPADLAGWPRPAPGGRPRSLLGCPAASPVRPAPRRLLPLCLSLLGGRAPCVVRPCGLRAAGFDFLPASLVEWPAPFSNLQPPSQGVRDCC